MKTTPFLGSVLLTLWLSQPAFATHCHQIDHFWVSFSLPSAVTQKPVATVLVQTALERSTKIPSQSRANSAELEDAKIVPLVKTGDHYFSKTILTSKTGECVDGVMPVVKFLVVYADGSEAESKVGTVTLEESTATEDENDRTFELIKDAASTQATHLKSQTAS